MISLWIPVLTIAQSADLEAKLTIEMESAQISGDFSISNYEAATTALRFVLNDKLKVNQLSLNGQNLSYEVIEEGCADCKFYDLKTPKKLTTSDILRIVIAGTFDRYEAGENVKDYKGKLVSNYNILRASEQSKWYPVIVENRELSSYVLKFPYRYAITTTCPDCKHIFIGKGEPQGKQGTFQSEEAEAAIMLIAGDYDWERTEQGIYLNMKEADILKMDSMIQSIRAYYSKLTSIPMGNEFILAHLPSDNPNWGGFVSYPAIVDVRKKAKTNNAAFISHELAHFYFGDYYEPKSNLFWFYLESFAEYFSHKYMLAQDANAIERDFNNLRRIRLTHYIPFIKSFKGNHFRFVKLAKVEHMNEVTGIHRYIMGSFQLLGMEHEIGEAKMMEFIPILFQNLKAEEHGYTTFINSLREVGVSEATIKTIEKKYFKRLKLKSYDFL